MILFLQFMWSLLLCTIAVNFWKAVYAENRYNVSNKWKLYHIQMYGFDKNAGKILFWMEWCTGACKAFISLQMIMSVCTDLSVHGLYVTASTSIVRLHSSVRIENVISQSQHFLIDLGSVENRYFGWYSFLNSSLLQVVDCPYQYKDRLFIYTKYCLLFVDEQLVYFVLYPVCSLVYFDWCICHETCRIILWLKIGLYILAPDLIHCLDRMQSWAVLFLHIGATNNIYISTFCIFIKGTYSKEIE